MVTSAPTTLRFGGPMGLPPTQSHKTKVTNRALAEPAGFGHLLPTPYRLAPHVGACPAEPGWGRSVPPSPSHGDQHLSPPCAAGAGGGHRMAEATRSPPCPPPAAPPAEETHCGFDRHFSAGSVPWSTWICPTAPHRHREGDCSRTSCFCSNLPSTQLQLGGSTLLFKQLRETQIPQPSPAT